MADKIGNLQIKKKAYTEINKFWFPKLKQENDVFQEKQLKILISN